MQTPQKPVATEKRVHIPYPDATRQFPFSSAVIVGNTAYLAGHLGLDPATHSIPDDLETEVHIMMKNFRDTITRAGLTINDLVYVQIFCSDVSLFDRFNAVYAPYFKYPLPARAFLGSGTLLFGAHFEIQGIAVKGSDA